MKKKILFNLGIGAIVLAYVLNLSYATDNYGIKKNSLSFSVLALSGSSGGRECDVDWTGDGCCATTYTFYQYGPIQWAHYTCTAGFDVVCLIGTAFYNPIDGTSTDYVLACCFNNCEIF